LALIFFSFIHDDPRPSASSAFYCEHGFRDRKLKAGDSPENAALVVRSHSASLRAGNSGL
jgi:hypothetical protein